MKRGIALLLAALLAVWQLPSQAQSRVFNQAELDALLAPVALYPDPVLSNILEAATYPDDLREAAAWSRANPQLTGEDAVRAAEPIPWHPSVKALLAFPELLARMNESPQWTADLGMAFQEQEPYVMDTVQGLRRRAQASGSLQSNDQYSVQQEGSSIAVYPAQPQSVYVPYYDPYVVYGPWWWPAYRPIFWRPWFTHPTVFVSTTTFFVRSVDWHRRHVVRHFHHHPPRPVQGHPGQHWTHQPKHHDFRPDRQHHSRQQWAGEQPRWRDQPQRWREQQRPQAQAPRANPPAAPVPSANMPQPVAPLGGPVRTIIEPVRPIGQPVRPISDTVRTQPQPGQRQARREVHGDRRGQATPPVTIHNQSRDRPIIDSGRPTMDAGRVQPQLRQLRSSVETIRNQPRPAAQPQRPLGNHSAPGPQVRQMVQTIRNSQPHFQHRGAQQRQPGRQANHHSQRRG
jgi:hypothetical protein